jgi:hypothetical protein
VGGGIGDFLQEVALEFTILLIRSGQWRIPVIISIPEAEVGRITVPGQSRLLKKLLRPFSTDVMIHPSHLSNGTKHKWEDHSPGQPGQRKKTKTVRPYLKNNQSTKDWRCDSGSGRVPAQQAQSPEFKPQYHCPPRSFDSQNVSVSI